MARKRFTERQVIECLAWQGIFVTCYRCGKPFFERNDTSLSKMIVAAAAGERVMHMALKPEREHLHEYGLDGSDDAANCRYSCADCHKVITNGTKATTAGSSKQRIAKVKRLRGETCNGPKQKIPSRPLRSRTTFPKRLHAWPARGSRTMNRKRRP